MTEVSTTNGAGVTATTAVEKTYTTFDRIPSALALQDSLKRCGSVGGRTHSTMAESEYSITASSAYGVDKTHKEGTDDHHDHDFEDSLSSHEEADGQLGEEEDHDNIVATPVRMPREKVPSSLHIPSVLEEAVGEQAEEKKTEEEEEVPPSPTKKDSIHPVLGMEDPADDLVADVAVPEEEAVVAGDDDASVSTAPIRKSLSMTKYKPSDRSIAVALTPAKSQLRRHSSYGNKNDKIPLNFEKRGSVCVLPKPNMRVLGQRELARRASAPAVQSNSSPKKRRSVLFEKIAIREHRVTLGDNPSCSYGTPISLDWDYIDFEELSLEDYEMHKLTSGRGRPRTLRQMYLNHFQRIHRLQQEGYTLDQIKAVKHQTNKARKQRDRTRFLAQAKVLVHIEDIVESAGRKVSRALSGKGKETAPTTYSSSSVAAPRKASTTMSKEQEKLLLLKVMGGDDTVDTARVFQNERNSHLMPISIRPIEA